MNVFNRLILGNPVIFRVVPLIPNMDWINAAVTNIIRMEYPLIKSFPKKTLLTPSTVNILFANGEFDASDSF